MKLGDWQNLSFRQEVMPAWRTNAPLANEAWLFLEPPAHLLVEPLCLSWRASLDEEMLYA